LVKIALGLTIPLTICLILVSVYLKPKVDDVVELHLLLAVPDHEGSGVEFQVFFVYRSWDDVVVVQVFPLSLLCLIRPSKLRLIRISFVGCRRLGCVVGRQFGVENGEGLCVVELVPLLVVKADSQEINTLMVQIDVPEGLEMH
jgi:hypothetical protein